MLAISKHKKVVWQRCDCTAHETHAKLYGEDSDPARQVRVQASSAYGVLQHLYRHPLRFFNRQMCVRVLYRHMQRLLDHHNPLPLISILTDALTVWVVGLCMHLLGTATTTGSVTPYATSHNHGS